MISKRMFDVIFTERVPGPPQNVRIELEKDNSIKVMWDEPLKNPDKVELYR